MAGAPVPGPDALAVSPTAWMRGAAEAASELRRHLLDRLREGDLDRGESLLQAMDDVYATLVVVDYPDALTNGLRRTLDALRAVARTQPGRRHDHRVADAPAAGDRGRRTGLIA